MQQVDRLLPTIFKKRRTYLEQLGSAARIWHGWARSFRLCPANLCAIDILASQCDCRQVIDLIEI